MKLTRIEVKNFRSFTDVDIDLSDGVNAFVGPNNSGKSNLVKALRMALDPDYPFDPAVDIPGHMAYAYPRTTLMFKKTKSSSSEATLFKYLGEYERTVSRSTASTYADAGEVRLVVTYRGGQSNPTRQEYFAARGGGDRRGDPDLNEKAKRQFHKVVRFVVVESGQSLEQLLAGPFHEIVHGVLADDLQKELDDASTARDEYIAKLETGLLAPMRQRVLAISRRLFPEVSDVLLIPSVRRLEETISNASIRLTDSVESELRDKGTGVAGAMLIALLRYITETSRQSMVLAVEEPEAFLHPAAQEDLKFDLESLAEKTNTTLLVTTHSPYILSRSPDARVIAIEKAENGVSAVSAAASGDEPQAQAISGLFRGEMSVPELLDRLNTIPAEAKAILLVEGSTDRDFLLEAAKRLGYSEKVKDLHVVANRGVDSLAIQAVLLRSQSDRPVWSLLDSDEPGRNTRDLLRKKFNVDPSHILEYGSFIGRGHTQDAEAEWLFPESVMQRFVDKFGEENVLNSKTRRAGEFRYDFTPEGKELLPVWLSEKAKNSDFDRWKPILEKLNAMLSALP